MQLLELSASDGVPKGYARIDAEDVEYVAPWSWSLTSHGYAARGQRIDGRLTVIYLHRFLMNASDGIEVDHINGDRLDCRRSNLRLATRAQNRQNTPSVGGASRHRGVAWSRPAGKWRAYGKVNGRQHHLGLFDDEDGAAAVAAAWRAEHLPFAVESRA